VVGGGVVGLSTAAELVRLGADVICYEQGRPMSERSAGETRIVRLAHAYPDMVELASRARRLFTEWGERPGHALVDEVGTVVSGDGVAVWAKAMTATGADHAMAEEGSPLLRLPARRLEGQALVDPAGGVIRVNRVKDFLTAGARGLLRRVRVDSIEETSRGVRVRSAAADDYDAAVICAGAGTSAPMACVGVGISSALEHHVRFSLPIRSTGPGPWQCWITDPNGRRGTYRHMSTPGTWAVGAHVDRLSVAWEAGPPAVKRASLQVVASYVARELQAVEPRVVERLYCTHHPDLGDGFRFARQGPIIAVYGENLFKVAPLLGNLGVSLPKVRAIAGPGGVSVEDEDRLRGRIGAADFSEYPAHSPRSP
jgi:sarcosine oxidase